MIGSEWMERMGGGVAVSQFWEVYAMREVGGGGGGLVWVPGVC